MRGPNPKVCAGFITQNGAMVAKAQILHGAPNPKCWPGSNNSKCCLMSKSKFLPLAKSWDPGLESCPKLGLFWALWPFGLLGPWALALLGQWALWASCPKGPLGPGGDLSSWWVRMQGPLGRPCHPGLC